MRNWSGSSVFMSDVKQQQLFLSATECCVCRHLFELRDFLRGPKKVSTISECCNHSGHCGASNSFKVCRRPLTSAQNTTVCVWQTVQRKCATVRKFFFLRWESMLHRGLDFPWGASKCACWRAPIKAKESTTKHTPKTGCDICGKVKTN